MWPPSFPQSRAYGPWDARQQRNTRLVYNEAQLRAALTAAYDTPAALSTIRIASDITITAPITINSPTTTQRIDIDGAGNNKIRTSGTFSPLFDIRTPVSIRNASIDATNISKVFSVQGNVETLLRSLTITTSGDGYVFDLTPGEAALTHSNTQLDDISITDDGTLSAVFGLGPSSQWSASNIRLFGVTAGLFPSSGDQQYTGVRVSNLHYETTTGSLLAECHRCFFSGLANVSSINTHNGADNAFSGLSVSTTGTITPGARDVISSATNYTITPSISMLSLSNTGAVFVDGLQIGQTSTTVETTAIGKTTTTDGTIKTAVNIGTTTGTGYYVESDIVARQTNDTNETNTYKIGLRVKNNGGVLTAGTATKIYLDEEVAAWDATIDTSGTNIRIRVTGAAATNISWGVVYRVRQI